MSVVNYIRRFARGGLTAPFQAFAGPVRSLRPGQVADPEGFEPLEVTIVRHDPVDSVLMAHSRDPGVEHQVATGIGPLGRVGQDPKKLGAGTHDMADRGSDEAY